MPDQIDNVIYKPSIEILAKYAYVNNFVLRHHSDFHKIKRKNFRLKIMYPERYNRAMEEIDIEIYETITGKRPFEIWVKEIKERHTRSKILTRLDRLKLGNFGDCKTLQEGVSELRIHYGPGIRIYYGKVGNKVILLLCGCDKSSQNRDIEKAKEFLRDYQSRRI